MENITNFIILIGSLFGAVTTIVTALTVIMKKILNKIVTPINKKIDENNKILNDKMDNLDLGQARNYLVDFLADIENGEEKDECQIERAYELYDHYTKDLGGNSYIHAKWEKVMGERK